MNRIVTWISGLLLVAGLVGCAPKTKQLEDTSGTKPEQVKLEDVTPAGEEDSTAAQPGEEAMGVDLGKSTDTTPKVETVTPDEPTATPGSGTVRIHVVQKGDTLYNIARMYYGNQTFWRKIWNANRAKVPDPNKITPGMELVIP